MATQFAVRRCHSRRKPRRDGDAGEDSKRHLALVTQEHKAENEPIPEDLRASFAIWSQPWFKPFESDEMWSEAGEREAFIWFIGP